MMQIKIKNHEMLINEAHNKKMTSISTRGIEDSSPQQPKQTNSKNIKEY